MTLKPRHQKLLEELPKNGYKVYPSAIKAGYKASYALKAPSRIIKTAIKAQAKEIIQNIDNKPLKEAKQSLASIIGMSDTEVFERLRYIAKQEKDLSTALKVLAPLSKDLGVPLDDETTKVTVPILNIGVRPASEQDTINIESATDNPNS